MLKWFRQILTAPVFEGDVDRTNMAKHVHTMTWLTLLMMLAYAIALPILDAQLMARDIFLIPLFALQIVVLAWVRRGQVRLGAMVSLVGFWVMFGIASFTSGGVRSAPYNGHIVLILIAAILLGWRAALGLAGMSLAQGLVLVWAERNGMTPPLSTTPMSALLLQAAFFITGAGSLHFATLDIKEALDRASHELSERRRAEEALRESEHQYRTTLEAMGDAIHVVDRDLRFVLFNTRFLDWNRKLNLTTDVIGKDLLQVFPFLPEDVCDEYARVFQTGEVLMTEESTRLQGQEIFTETRKIPILREGKVFQVVTVIRDITERKCAEEALRESEQLYRTLINVMPEGVALSDLSGNITFASPQLLAVHGVTTIEEGVGTNALQWIAPESREKALANLQGLTRNQVPFDHEYVLLKKDGTRFPGEVSGALLVDDKGDPKGLVTVHRDITERKRAEEEIRRLNQALERRARGLAALNKASRLMVSTLELDTLLGLVMEQIKSLLDVEAASLTLRELGPAGEELVFVAATGPGSERLVGVRMPATVGIAGWVMRETLPAIVTDVRSDPRFYDRIDAVTGMTVRSLLAVPLVFQDTVLGVVEAVNKLPVDEHGAFDQDDLEMLEALAGSAAIAIQNARLYRAEREAFRRLQESQAQLVQAEKMGALGRLVASITHEINNPLQTIQNSLELAEEELEGSLRREKLTRYLSLARTEIERLAGILRRLRDFYRPVRQEMQPTDVHAVLRGVLDLTSKQLQHANIAVELEQAYGLPLVQATPDHLKQVFLNLVLNAIDAMSGEGRSGGTLTVRTALDQMQTADNRWVPAVCIELSDTGNGIPPEILPRIFEPFVTTKGTGTGLGLSISYGIIEAHGGRITVASEVGVGTTFTVMLPAIET